MLNRSCPRVVLVGLTALLTASVPISRADAQDKGSADDRVRFNKYADPFTKLRDGTLAPDPVKDKDLVEVAARYFVYRVTSKTFQDEKSSSSSGMEKVLSDLNKEMTNKNTESGANRDFMKLLAPELIACLKHVFEYPFDTYKSGITNAALMLPILAKCKQPVVHDYLLEIVTKPDPKTDKPYHAFIRMCAIKGLGEFNADKPGPVLDDPTSQKDQDAKKARETARLAAIMQFIDQPYPPEGTGKEYDDAFAYVRREGVKALAQTKMPMQVIKSEIKIPVAYHLLKIANGDPVAVGPPITLSEKLEAAIALCNLKATDPQQDKLYNPDPAVYVVANVLNDLSKAYSADVRYFKTLKKDEVSPLPRLPWKSYATRLESGLTTMAQNLKGTPNAKKVEDLHKIVKPMLADIKTYQPITLERFLPDFAIQIRPANGEVYRGSKEFILSLGDKGGE